MSIGLSLLACLLPRTLAQNPGKADVVAALDEVTYDTARFERILALAQSMGLSKARIVIARFDYAFWTCNLDAIKHSLPELEPALSSVPADEAGTGLAQFREAFPQFKKIITSGDPTRVNALLQQYKHKAEAEAILADLQQIDVGVRLYAIEKNLQTGATVLTTEWIKHAKVLSRLRETGADIFGNKYGNQIVDKAPVPNSASLEKIGKHVPVSYFDITKKD